MNKCIVDLDSWKMPIMVWQGFELKDHKKEVILDISNDCDIAIRVKGDKTEGIIIHRGDSRQKTSFKVGYNDKMEIRRYAPKEPTPRTGIRIIQLDIKVKKK